MLGIFTARGGKPEDAWSIRNRYVVSRNCVLPYIAVYSAHPRFWPRLPGKKSFVLIFNSIVYLFILRYWFDVL